MYVNLVGVLLATVARFVLGAIWYGPLFAKPWMKELGKKESDLRKGNMGLMYGTTFLISLVSAYVLAMFLGHEMPLVADVFAALSVGLIWVAGSMATNYMFSGSSMKLWLIDAGYHVVGFALMGLVIGLLQ